MLRRIAIFNYKFLYFEVVLNFSSKVEKADIWAVFCYPVFQQFALFL